MQQSKKIQRNYWWVLFDQDGWCTTYCYKLWIESVKGYWHNYTEYLDLHCRHNSILYHVWLVYTKTVDSVDGARWLARQTPDILCYLPPSNSWENGIIIPHFSFWFCFFYYYVKQVDCPLPCICSVMILIMEDEIRTFCNTLSCHFVCLIFVLTTIWRHHPLINYCTGARTDIGCFVNLVCNCRWITTN